jgi:hypothetical protein
MLITIQHWGMGKIAVKRFQPLIFVEVLTDFPGCPQAILPYPTQSVNLSQWPASMSP